MCACDFTREIPSRKDVFVCKVDQLYALILHLLDSFLMLLHKFQLLFPAFLYKIDACGFNLKENDVNQITMITFLIFN